MKYTIDGTWEHKPPEKTEKGTIDLIRRKTIGGHNDVGPIVLDPEDFTPYQIIGPYTVVQVKAWDTKWESPVIIESYDKSKAINIEETMTIEEMEEAHFPRSIIDLVEYNESIREQAFEEPPTTGTLYVCTKPEWVGAIVNFVGMYPSSPTVCYIMCFPAKNKYQYPQAQGLPQYQYFSHQEFVKWFKKLD